VAAVQNGCNGNRGLTDFLFLVAGGIVTSVIASLVTQRIMASFKPSTVTGATVTTPSGTSTPTPGH